MTPERTAINEIPALKFLSWKELRLSRTGHIKYGRGSKTFIFKLKKTGFQESKKDFKLRSKNFKDDILKLRGIA